MYEDESDDGWAEGRKLAELIESAAGRVGLHPTSIQVGVNPDDPSTFRAVSQFMIGELAFSDRVQNPEAAAEADALTRLEVDADFGDFMNETLAEQMERRRRELGGDQE